MFGATGHLPELIIILILGLVILGPGKLPQVGGAVGKTIREFRKASTEADEDKAEEGNPEAAPVASTTAPAPAKPVTPPTTVKASGTSAATADKAEL